MAGMLISIPALIFRGFGFWHYGAGFFSLWDGAEVMPAINGVPAMTFATAMKIYTHNRTISKKGQERGSEEKEAV